jgi:plastocyanin domain-containing protein
VFSSAPLLFSTSWPASFTSNLENLSSLTQITIITFDPDSGILELHYRIDGKGPWMIAQNKIIPIELKIIYDDFRYGRLYPYGKNDFYVQKVMNAQWLVDIDTNNIIFNNQFLIINFYLLKKLIITLIIIILYNNINNKIA